MSSISSWLGERYPEVSCYDFYRDLFPSGELDTRGAFTKGKYCGIAVQVKGASNAFRFTICDDLDPITTLANEDDFLIISPISYAGKKQTQENARNLYAICFDLDGLLVKNERQVGIEALYRKMFVDETLPVPTYLVSSGTGLHLYYFLNEAVPLFGNVLKQLWKFRMALTNAIWDETITSKSTNPQYESATQGFRAVGSICKDGVNRVRAFKVGDRVSIEYLNGFVEEQCRIQRFTYKSSFTLANAKEKYPDWYERRIVQGQPKGTWTCHRGLYEWWLNKVRDGQNKFPAKARGAQSGHRYFSVMALAIYARKSGIPYKEVEKDALSLVELLDSRSTDEDNRFSKDDVMKALEAYNASYITFPRDTIMDLTQIHIEPNKRRPRKIKLTRQKQIVLARAVCETLYPEGEWRNENGRYLYKKNGKTKKVGEKKEYPTIAETVRSYKRDNPEKNNSQIARELGISRPTVIKWLKAAQESDCE